MIQWIDRDGWPVEFVEGRRIRNFIRVLLHADMKNTWLRTYRPNDIRNLGRKSIPRAMQEELMINGFREKP